LHTTDLIHDQNAGRTFTVVNVQTELVDGIVRRRALLAFGALLQAEPTPAEN
jgi:hypothetical protein